MSAPITGDALLLGLAAEYRRLTTALLAFDDEELHWSGSMADYLRFQAEDLNRHREAILAAIAAVEADGFAGILVQLEVLHLWNEGGPLCEHRAQSQRQALIEAILWSIRGVVGSHPAGDAIGGIEIMKPHRNARRSDIAALISEWRAVFDVQGIEYAEVPRTKPIRAEARA